MDIGKLRKRIDIYEITLYLADDIGGASTDKTLEATIWAEVTEITGSRSLDFQSAFNNQPLEVKFRTDSYALSPNSIISYEGVDLTTHSITKDPLKRITTVIGWRNQV